MGFGDLFKSKKEREREEKKKRRRAFREAESAVDVVKGRIAKLKKEHQESWTEARQYLKDGQKAAAQRCLQSCRAAEIMISKVEMKRWVFEQLLTKLELAKTDQEFTKSLEALNTVVHIDPDAVEDVLDEVNEKLGEQVDTDKIWENVYGKEMEGVKSDMTDTIPSMEEMQKLLTDEVAAEIGGSVSGEKETSSGGAVEGRIGEARDRLRKLMEEEK
jgi:hypothetical protein